VLLQHQSTKLVEQLGVLSLTNHRLVWRKPNDTKELSIPLSQIESMCVCVCVCVCVCLCVNACELGGCTDGSLSDRHE